MKTLTENIYVELVDGIKEPAGLPDVLKKYGHSKGPLYVALAQATSSLTEKVTGLAAQYQELGKVYQDRQEEVKGAEQKQQGLDMLTKTKTQELASLEDKVKQVQAIVDIGNDLTGVGFGLNELTKLRNILTEIGIENGVAPGKAGKHFFDKVDNYQKLVSLEAELKASKIAAQKARAEGEQWQAQAKAVESKSKARQSSINLVEKLLAQGVKEVDLPRWEHILSRVGIAPEKLAEALDKFATIEKLCHDRREYAKKFETQAGNLTAQVKALSEAREKVSAAIKDLREKALAEIAAMSEQTLEKVGSQSQNASHTLESIRQKTVVELESVSKMVLQNIQSLVGKSAEYIVLERQAAKLAEELVLARAIKSQNPEDWKRVSRQAVRELLSGIILWIRLDQTHNPVLSSPPTPLARRISIYYSVRVPLDEVLMWALTGTFTQQERDALASGKPLI